MKTQYAIVMCIQQFHLFIYWLVQPYWITVQNYLQICQHSSSVRNCMAENTWVYGTYFKVFHIYTFFL